MNKRKNVELVLYRYAGKFLFFRIKAHCKECDISNAILQRLINEQLRDKPVTLKIVPWLDNFWKVIWRGGWHAPILTVNGRIFSQGIVPDIPRLLLRIGKILHDASLNQNVFLIREGEKKGVKAPETDFDTEVRVYYSPACPHCKKLLSFLEENRIEYSGHDVTKTETVRDEVFRLTKRLAIPVTVIKGEVIVGFDRESLSRTFGVTSGDESKVAVKEKIKTPQFTRGSLKHYGKKQ